MHIARFVSVLRLLSVLEVFGAASAGAQSSTIPGAELGFFKSDTTSLRFELDRPTGPGPFPIIVFVHGSGRATHDEMLNLVSKFTERGFAVFRYDKRGVGESGGRFRGVNAATSREVIPELARDAAAAFATACAARDIDASRCGFFGASQAGWIIPEAMLLVKNPSFAILFSGATIPVGLQMHFAGPNPAEPSPLDSAYQRLPDFAGDPGFDSGVTLGRLPAPTLWLLGLQDKLLPNRRAALQLDSLRARGVPLTIRTFPTYGHSLGADIWPEIDAFLAPFRRK